MIKRSSIIIDPKKSKEFTKFLNTTVKDKKFWDEIKKGASVRVNKEELDKLFEE